MAHLLMLHGHPVGYLPPTYASEILTSGGDTVQKVLDDKFIIVENVTGTTDSSGLIDLRNIIPSGYAPIYLIVGTSYVVTFFNGSANPNVPYMKITNYDGTTRANYQIPSSKILCVKI